MQNTYKRQQPPFFQVNKEAMPQMSTKLLREYPTALDLWWHLNAISNRLGVVVASQTALAEMIGAKSRSSVYRAVRYLVKNHYIKVGKIGTQNVYIINPNLVWQTTRDYGKDKLEKNGIVFPSATVLTKKENRGIYNEYEKFKAKHHTGSVDLSKIDFNYRHNHHGRANKNGEVINHHNYYTKIKSSKIAKLKALRTRLGKARKENKASLEKLLLKEYKSTNKSLKKLVAQGKNKELTNRING